MKTQKFEKRLSLNKSTVSNLSTVDMNRLNGGVVATGGCSDGTICSIAGYCSQWNCTRTQCTADPCGIYTYTCQLDDLEAL